jgi:hypothetical protein
MVPTWHKKAACSSHIPLFQAVDFDGSQRRFSDPNVIAARKVCFSCPVRQTCFESAMEEEKYDNSSARTGMRGGHTARERTEIAAKNPNCARCGSPKDSNPISLAHVHLTCPSCSKALNNSLDARYFSARKEEVQYES